MQAVGMAANVDSIRPTKAEDAPVCGRICYEAFAAINAAHGYEPDFPSIGAATSLLEMLFAHRGFYTVVAESNGQIAGSNSLDERSAIAGVGPITVDPAVQNGGIGRMLMESVLERADAAGFVGVRLVQAAFHARSLSLYTKLGFQVREPLALMRGPALGYRLDGYDVRRAVMEDLNACNRVCSRVHGHDRDGETREAIGHGAASVVVRDGRVSGYSTTVGFFGHTVGETLPDVQALIGAAETFAGAGILVPVRDAALFRWCLDRGLRVAMPLNLMTRGLYNEPAGTYLPSILY